MNWMLIVWIFGAFFSAAVQFDGIGTASFVLAPFWPIQIVCWVIAEIIEAWKMKETK